MTTASERFEINAAYLRESNRAYDISRGVDPDEPKHRDRVAETAELREANELALADLRRKKLRVVS